MLMNIHVLRKFLQPICPGYHTCNE